MVKKTRGGGEYNEERNREREIGLDWKAGEQKRPPRDTYKRMIYNSGRHQRVKEKETQNYVWTEM